MFQFSCCFACYHVIVSQTAYRKQRVHAVRFSQLLSTPFLAALETQIFVNNPQYWWPMDPPASHEISLTVGWLFLTQQQRLNCVDVFISVHCVCRCPDACRLAELHQQPIALVTLMLFFVPSFAHKLRYNCRALKPLHWYRYLIEILSPLLNRVKVAAFA